MITVPAADLAFSAKRFDRGGFCSEATNLCIAGTATISIFTLVILKSFVTQSTSSHVSSIVYRVLPITPLSMPWFSVIINKIKQCHGSSVVERMPDFSGHLVVMRDCKPGEFGEFLF